MNDGQPNEQVQAEEQVSATDLRERATDLREASFPQARRGYDREAVHAFLDRIADWVEAASSGGSQLTSEFAKVGERTAGILTAAEQAAAKLRSEAKEYAEGLRASAEEEARKVKLNAGQRADELVAEAESKASGIVEEAVARRRRLNQAVVSLIERREEIADQSQRLADQLLTAVEAIRTDEPIPHDEDIEATPTEQPIFDELEDAEAAEAERSRLIRAGFEPDGEVAADEPTELEAPDERETAIHDTRAN